MLDRDGYIVVRDALDAGAVERLRIAFETAPAESGTQHVRIGPDTPHEADWLALRVYPALLEAAREVLGPAFHVRDAHGRNPLPGYGQQGLHADWPSRARGAPAMVLTALWMLDDFRADNGATRVVPGSHLLYRALPRALAQPLARHPDEVIVTGKAGSVLIFNGHLWHSGRRNEGPGPRRSVQMVVQAGPSRRGERS